MNQDSEHPAVKCDKCFKHDVDSHPSLLRCTDCKLVYYCSVDCQRQDWKEHKVDCRNIKMANGRTYNDDVHCPVCLETKEGLHLPNCNHRCCYDCLKNVYDHRQDRNAQIHRFLVQGHATNILESEIPLCPLCRTAMPNDFDAAQINDCMVLIIRADKFEVGSEQRNELIETISRKAKRLVDNKLMIGGSVRFFLAQFQILKGEYVEAIESVNKILNNAGKCVEEPLPFLPTVSSYEYHEEISTADKESCYRVLGECQYYLRDYRNAIANLQLSKCLKVDTTLLLAQCFDNLGHSKTAINLFELLCLNKLHRAKKDSHQPLIKLHRDACNLDQAIHWARRAIFYEDNLNVENTKKNQSLLEELLLQARNADGAITTTETLSEK